MSEYRNTFYSFADRSCDPEKWESYFVRYNADDWDAEGGGVLQYFTDTELEYDLIICHWKGLGFALQYQCRNLRTNRPVFCKYAVADADGLDRFEEQDDLRFPTGCFLPPSTTWLAVEDFLNNGEQLSQRVQWVDDGDFPWSE